MSASQISFARLRELFPDLWYRDTSLSSSIERQNDPEKELYLSEDLTDNRNHPSNLLFKKWLNRAWQMRIAKGRDYGADADPFANVREIEQFGYPDWFGAAIRMNDKMVRIRNYIKRGELHNESVDDDLLDMAVYALIALVMREEAGSGKEANGSTALS